MARAECASAVADLLRTAVGVGYARRAVAIVHHRIQTVAFLLEARHHGPFEGTATRQLHPHRIDEPAIDQDFVVDVGAGRLPGRADEADDLTLPHAFSGF